MQMRNSLPAVFARVNRETKARLVNSEICGELGYYVNENVCGEFLILRLEMCDALNVFSRDNQNVNRSFGR